MKGMKPNADNPAMVMDLYELTMANGYFLEPQVKDTKVAFDVFFRRIPDGGGFAVFAGLEQIVDYITNLHFDKDDVDIINTENWYLYKSGTNIDMHQYWPIFDVNIAASNGTLWNDYEY